MDNKQKIINLLSMAARAGKVESGEYAVTHCLSEQKAALVCLATDLSPEVAKKYENLALEQAPVVVLPLDKQTLGGCIGKNERAAVAVCNGGFADAIKKKL